MVNYQLGKIYKIVGNGLTYYGSTCEPTLARRLSGHVASYNRYKHGKYHYMSSFNIIELEDYNIILVECFACDTKDQLHARERYFIETNECINKCIPGRAVKESYKVYRDTHKESIKVYRDTHKESHKVYRDTHKESRKVYCDTHKERISEQQKIYKDTHKEQINEQRKIYRDTHKEQTKLYRDTHKEQTKLYRDKYKEIIQEKRSKKSNCECGGKYTHGYKSRHLKTKKHLDFITQESAMLDNSLLL
jgi:hypothetical protein